MKIMYLDESGDHNLDKIQDTYPVFVLTGVVVKDGIALREIETQFNQLKQQFFGTEEIIFHTSDMTRNRNGFEKMKDAQFKNHFCDALNTVMMTSKYQVIAAVIDKKKHKERYGDNAFDPYHLCLSALIERFCFEIGNKAAGGMIIAEKRSKLLDKQLQLVWGQMCTSGTRHLAGSNIAKRIGGFHLAGKKENIAGLQLADLIASPIGRYVMGKPVRKDFRIIEKKFRCNGMGDYKGYGLVTIPK